MSRQQQEKISTVRCIFSGLPVDDWGADANGIASLPAFAHHDESSSLPIPHVCCTLPALATQDPLPNPAFARTLITQLSFQSKLHFFGLAVSVLISLGAGAALKSEAWPQNRVARPPLTKVVIPVSNASYCFFSFQT